MCFVLAATRVRCNANAPVTPYTERERSRELMYIACDGRLLEDT